MIVRCKTQHCQAIGEGKTLDDAINNVDHAIALSRHPNGCVGFPTAKYEVVEKQKDDTYKVIKDVDESFKEKQPSSSQKTSKKDSES